MLATDAIKNLIREAKTPQMVNVMQMGVECDMRTLDQALIDLCRRRLISPDEALSRCREPQTARKAIAAFGTYQT